MSKAEIIAEIAKLSPAEREELWDDIWKIQESLLPSPGTPTEEEKVLLREELEEYRKDGFDGRPWEEIKERLLRGK